MDLRQKTGFSNLLMPAGLVVLAVVVAAAVAAGVHERHKTIELLRKVEETYP